MVKINSLSKRYGHAWVIRGVNIRIAKGQAVGLLGANGAGKSTLIKSMLDLVHASEGSIEMGGTCAYLPENPQLPLAISALSLLTFKCKTNQLPTVQATQTLADVKLDKQASKLPMRQYSKGMRQRASLAFSLCGKPEIMLLDEPMSGLDALGKADILALLKSRKEAGTTLLMSSHIVSDMVRLCDSILIMAHGNIRESVQIKDHSLAEVTSMEAKLAYWTEQTA